MANIGSARIGPLLVGATVTLAGFGLALPSVAAPAPSSTGVTLTSGTTLKSEWFVENLEATDNGLPQGGDFDNAPGLGVDDPDMTSTTPAMRWPTHSTPTPSTAL
jgi:hypothetical protein